MLPRLSPALLSGGFSKGLLSITCRCVGSTGTQQKILPRRGHSSWGNACSTRSFEFLWEILNIGNEACFASETRYNEKGGQKQGEDRRHAYCRLRVYDMVVYVVEFWVAGQCACARPILCEGLSLLVAVPTCCYVLQFHFPTYTTAGGCSTHCRSRGTPLEEGVSWFGKYYCGSRRRWVAHFSRPHYYCSGAPGDAEFSVSLGGVVRCYYDFTGHLSPIVRRTSSRAVGYTLEERLIYVSLPGLS